MLRQPLQGLLRAFQGAEFLDDEVASFSLRKYHADGQLGLVFSLRFETPGRNEMGGPVHPRAFRHVNK
jgi:hypothetical protein